MVTAIESRRLLLRPLTWDDAPFVLALVNDPAFVRFIGDKGVKTIEDARAYIGAGWPRDGYTRLAFCAIERRADGGCVGLCSLVRRAGLDAADLGFALLPAFRRQGFAIEAAAAMLTHARETLGLSRVLAITTPDNAASIRVLEALGFGFDRIVRLAPSAPELRLFEWTAPPDDPGRHTGE